MNILILFLLFVLTGCVSTSGNHVNSPSLAGERSSVDAIGKHTIKASGFIKNAQDMIVDAEKQNPAFTPTLSLIDTPLVQAQQELEASQKQVNELEIDLITKQKEIDSVTFNMNKLSDKLATYQLYLTRSHERIWQLWIALVALVLLVIGFFLLRQFVPFLKLI